MTSPLVSYIVIPHLAVDQSEVGAVQWSQIWLEEVSPSRRVFHVQCAGCC